MKNNEKRIYISPSFELLKTEREDVISTSGFNGDDHVLSRSEPTSAYMTEE